MQKENRKYYEAYEDRYKTAHEKGVSWTQMKNTPIVMDIIKRYHLHPEQSLLEIGCPLDYRFLTNFISKMPPFEIIFHQFVQKTHCLHGNR